MNRCILLYLCLLTITHVTFAQLGIGGMYGNPYAIGGFPYGMGMQGGLGYNMLNNPYGYGSYYDYRCRNLLGGGYGGYGGFGGYNPIYGGMLGKK